ncbi:MAG: DUF4390 domain-containing protein [Gammaproteobacteria bacterium]|nr:DUF4390 domain-containing protein [Gammaproteobacteria bacterium]
MRAILIALVLLVASPPVVAQGFAQNISIELSPEAVEAVDNGVRLKFDARFAKQKQFWLVRYKKQIKEHSFQLQRHALSRRYVVRRDDIEAPRIFRSINDAMKFIAGQALQLLEFYNADSPSINLRLVLDQYSLPGPMRLNAFISDAWDIDSGWVTVAP